MSDQAPDLWCVVYGGRSVWEQCDNEGTARMFCEQHNKALAEEPDPERCTVVRYAPGPAPAQRCSTCARWNTSRNCPVRSTRGPGWYCADWEERFIEPTTDGEGGKQ